MAIVYKSVQVPSDLLEALGDTEDLFWSSPAIEPIIHDAIRAWLKSPPADATQQPAASKGDADAGYQWKQLFLPEGTKLRASFGRQPYFAVVRGTEIRFDEHVVSPSGFANRYGSGNRNAWKAIWLRFPGSEQWLLADTCRTKQKAAIARLFSGDASESAPVQPTPPARRPAKRPAGPPPKQAHQPRMPLATHDSDRQHKRHARHSKRRKRRAAKYIPVNP